MLEEEEWYREVERRTPQVGRQVLLPEMVQREALRVVHDHLWAGHQGVNNTQQRLEARYFWPAIQRDVRDYCWSSPICQWGNKRPPPRAPLHPVPLAENPFECVAMDFIGPFLPEGSPIRDGVGGLRYPVSGDRVPAKSGQQWGSTSINVILLPGGAPQDVIH